VTRRHYQSHKRWIGLEGWRCRGGGGEVEDRDKWRESWVHLKYLVYLAHLHTGLHHYACVEEGKVHDDMAELVATQLLRKRGRRRRLTKAVGNEASPNQQIPATI
jgi:hypothetical protein